MLSDGTKIEAKSIESIYNYLTNAGVDPSQGIIVKKSQKAVNIGSGSESSHTYELTTLCGDKTIMFNTIIDKIEDDHFFTQIYVAGISDAADTTAATAAAE